MEGLGPYGVWAGILRYELHPLLGSRVHILRRTPCRIADKRHVEPDPLEKLPACSGGLMSHRHVCVHVCIPTAHKMCV